MGRDITICIEAEIDGEWVLVERRDPGRFHELFSVLMDESMPIKSDHANFTFVSKGTEYHIDNCCDCIGLSWIDIDKMDILIKTAIDESSEEFDLHQAGYCFSDYLNVSGDDYLAKIRSLLNSDDRGKVTLRRKIDTIFGLACSAKNDIDNRTKHRVVFWFDQ